MMTAQKRVFKIDEVIFSHHKKSFANKVSSKLNDYVKSYSCPNFNIKTAPNDDVISG